MDITKIAELKKLGFTNEQIIALVNPAKETANTSKSVVASPSTSVDAKLHAAMNHRKFKSEPKVDVKVAVPYGKQTGGYIHLGINGTVIELPCDGVSRKIPKSFADLLDIRLAALDAQDSASGYLIGDLDGVLGKGKIEAGDVIIDTKTY